MKRIMKLVLPILILTSQLKADDYDWLAQAQDEMNATHHTGGGCEDGVFTAISTSMIGWGIGLFVGIALLTGLVHQSTQAHATTTTGQ